MVVSRKRRSGNALMVLFRCLLSSLGLVECDVTPGRLFLAVWKEASSPPSYLDIPPLHRPHQGTWRLSGTQIHLTLLVFSLSRAAGVQLEPKPPPAWTRRCLCDHLLARWWSLGVAQGTVPSPKTEHALEEGRCRSLRAPRGSLRP